MLGVEATVQLFRKQERAVVKLHGLPVGGMIAGVAQFKSDGWTIDLDQDLRRALARRHVRIAAAGAYADYSSVWVIIHLTLGIGRKTMTLHQITY